MEKLSHFLDKGEHSCAFYADAEEKYQIIFPYFRAGILLNEKCIFVGNTEDYQHIEKQLYESSEQDFIGKIEKSLSFLSHEKYILHTLSQKNDPSVIVEQWTNLIEKYLSEGFQGGRVAGVFAPDYNRKLNSLIFAYERAVAPLFEKYPLSAVCLYPESVKNTSFGKKIRSTECHPVRAKKINV